jgi:hypothetical protein
VGEVEGAAEEGKVVQVGAEQECLQTPV